MCSFFFGERVETLRFCEVCTLLIDATVAALSNAAVKLNTKTEATVCVWLKRRCTTDDSAGGFEPALCAMAIEPSSASLCRRCVGVVFVTRTTWQPPTLSGRMQARE